MQHIPALQAQENTVQLETSRNLSAGGNDKGAAAAHAESQRCRN